MEKIGAVINRVSGDLPPDEADKRMEVVRQLLEKRVTPGCLAMVSGDRIGREIRRLIEEGVDVLVVGGGDGTISTAARYLAGRQTVLAVIGLGTRNHFARDLEIPAEPAEAIALLDRMHTDRIDLGEINGVTFINNASLGLYPKIVELREEKMLIHGWRKWPAHVVAALSVLWWLPRMRLVVETAERKSGYLTPFLFVGNNRYESRVISDARRESMKDGKLWYSLAKASGLWSLFRLAWQMRTGGVRNTDHLESFLTESLTVYTRRSQVRVAIDGENRDFSNPLHFRILRKSLQVVVP